MGKAPEDSLPHLTPRELQILAAIGRGLPTKAIARDLAVSERCVKWHLTNIYRKLDVPGRVAAVIWYDHHGPMLASTDSPLPGA